MVELEEQEEHDGLVEKEEGSSQVMEESHGVIQEWADTEEDFKEIEI